MFVNGKNESYRMINCKPGNDEKYESYFTYIHNLYKYILYCMFEKKSTFEKKISSQFS